MPSGEDGRMLRVRRDVLLVALTAASGATDALSFLGLGQVFTAVMTGNLVLLGIALGRGSLGVAVRAVAAILSFGLGVAISSRVTGRGDDAAAGAESWPSRVTVALVIEAFLEFGLVIGWLVTGGRPDGGVEVVLVAVSAVAMGIQSGAVHELGVQSLSTTYLTGTLAWIVSRLTGGERARGVALQASAIAAMIAGAAVTAAVLGWARRFAVLVPAGLVMVVAALALTGWSGRTKRGF